MKHRSPQSGFSLIELIAVMIIMAILAAVLLPRITTITGGAYESNLRTMYGVIKTTVNAEATKAAMKGGASGHQETFPDCDNSTANYYLDDWFKDFDVYYWYQENLNENYANTNGGGDNKPVDALVFHYMPHGLKSNRTYARDPDGAGSVAAGDAGISNNNSDIYYIYYAPHTTGNGGFDFDGYVLNAYKDDGDGDWEGTGTEEAITDMQWTSP